MEQSRREVFVGTVGDLAPGETRKFLLPTDGEPTEAFLVNVAGEVHAWVNRCRHIKITMDWVEGRFLDESRCWIVCATHGALYAPASGECVAGPPVGKSLIRVPLRVDGDRLIATVPDQL
jgi:nitrite reductase/ring-hydroxylating ferredoxin subunit